MTVGLMVKVRVRYLGFLQHALGVAEEDAEFAPGTTIQDLLLFLADRHGERWRKYVFTPAGKVRPSLRLMFNGTIMEHTDLEQPLGESCELCLVTGVYPLEGGG